LDVIESADYTLVPISAEVALRAGRFLSHHCDPFDRVIAAQALHEDIPLLSSDGKLDTFLVQRIW
jgi:PIN domain nuclease of toxin-antitoxin system